MRGGISGSTGIILYDTDKKGDDAVYGYYEGSTITIKHGNHKELADIKKKIEAEFKRKDKIKDKIMWAVVIVTLILMVASFLLTSFVKGIFLSFILVGAILPTVGMFYANISLYENDEDFQQFRRYHGCEHACLEMMSKERELTMENLKASGIYDSECGTVYMGYALTVLAVAAVVVLNFGTIGFLKGIGAILATIILLFINIFNPYNPYKLLQYRVVSKPTDKEYKLALELLKEIREL